MNYTDATQQMDEDVIKHLRPELLLGEPELYESKWWDYKPLHSFTATESFFTAYKDELRRAIRQRYDRDAAKYAKLAKTGALLDENKAYITGLWIARRTADAMGASYPEYCRFAMKYASICDWTYLPSPQQLYSTKMPENGSHSVLSYIEERWSEHLRDRSPMAEHPFFHPDNYRGHPYQVRYLKWLLERVSRSRFKPGVVHTLVVRHPLISEELLTARFGEDAASWLEQAHQLSMEQ